MRNSDSAPRFYTPNHFYRSSRGAQNRANPSRAIEERIIKFRQSDPQEVMFVVNYEDGRLRYITVSNMDLRNGDAAVFTFAAHKQQTGEIPTGKIIGIRRVH